MPDPDTFEIRSARPGDEIAIADIYRHAVLTDVASFEIVPPDAAEMARRRDAVLAAGLPYLVAEDGTGILGYAYATPYRVREAYRYTLENSVYVAERAQRRGIGLALVNAVIDDAAGKGYRQMIAVISGGRAGASVRLHERAGFVQVGILGNIGYKFDRWIDVVYMQRDLGDGGSTKGGSLSR